MTGCESDLPPRQKGEASVVRKFRRVRLLLNLVFWLLIFTTILVGQKPKPPKDKDHPETSAGQRKALDELTQSVGSRLPAGPVIPVHRKNARRFTRNNRRCGPPSGSMANITLRGPGGTDTRADWNNGKARPCPGTRPALDVARIRPVVSSERGGRGNRSSDMDGGASIQRAGLDRRGGDLGPRAFRADQPSDRRRNLGPAYRQAVAQQQTRFLAAGDRPDDRRISALADAWITGRPPGRGTRVSPPPTCDQSVCVAGYESGQVLPVQALSKNGYHLLHWKDDGMTYWAISDLDSAELKDFATKYASAK